MKHVSRRKFLRLVGTGVGVAAVQGLAQACSPKPATLTQMATTNTPFGAAANTSEPTQSAPSTESPTQAFSAPHLAVAKSGEPEDLVRRAVAALGGMGLFVTPGAKVMIKPNICVDYRTYDYAATTNPWVVGALVKMAFEAGAASVKVMDSPFGGTASQAYKISGIQEQVEAAGGKMVKPSGITLQDVRIPDAIYLTRTKIYQEFLDADVLINVPIAKDHGMAKLTLSMKNLMGIVEDRPVIHADFGNALTDLNFRIRSNLVVVDAVRILKYGGPQGGDLGAVEKLDTVIASRDVVAADAYAATLFGMDPMELEYVRVGTDRQLGQGDLSKLTIQQV